MHVRRLVPSFIVALALLAPAGFPAGVQAQNAAGSSPSPTPCCRTPTPTTG